MKVIIVISIILLLILSTSIRLKIYKVINKELSISIIITRSLKIRINLKKYIYKKLTKYIYDTSNEKKIKDIKNSIKTFNHHKELIKSLINLFNGNIIYLSINSYYYINNLNLYLSLYYLYSYIQNELYLNLHKVKNSCFKTRLKKTPLDLEVHIDLETKVYKLALFMIKRGKEIFKIKERYNEQSSNYRIVKNINVKY